MITRRGFIALAAAVATKPVTPECPRHLIVEVNTLSGIRTMWTRVPNGLRGVKCGQRFRMLHPDTRAVCYQARADEDGHDVTDADGYKCGGLFARDIECENGAWLV